MRFPLSIIAFSRAIAESARMFYTFKMETKGGARYKPSKSRKIKNKRRKGKK